MTRRGHRQQLNELMTIAAEHRVQIVAKLVDTSVHQYSIGDHKEISKQLLNMVSYHRPEKLFIQEISQLGASMLDVSTIVEELTYLRVSIYINNLKLETLLNGQRNPDAFVLFTLLSEIKQFQWAEIRNQLSRKLKKDKKRTSDSSPE